LVVGGTKGIGASIVDTLREYGGADVVCVGRTATSIKGGIAADLSSVKGCYELVNALAARACTTEVNINKRSNSNSKFSHVVFTVGAWPNFQQPFTSDGIHKVIMLDLVARHVILKQLIEQGLLSDESNGGCTVMSVLASGQKYPSFIFGLGTANDIRNRMKECVATNPVKYKKERKKLKLKHYGFKTMLDTSVCHDAWLDYMVTENKMPNWITVAGIFPGVLVSDLMGSTFPVWFTPVLKLLMWPIADTQEDMGMNHVAILSALSQQRKHQTSSSSLSSKTTMKDNNTARKNTATWWAAPLLEPHEINPLSLSSSSDGGRGLGLWTYNWLEQIVHIHK